MKLGRCATLLLLLVITCSAKFTTKWKATSKSGDWRVASSADGKFTAVAALNPDFLYFYNTKTGKQLASFEGHPVWMAATENADSPLAGSIFTLIYMGDTDTVVATEFHMGDNNSVIPGWTVDLGTGYPALSKPLAVSATGAIVAALTTDDTDQDNRTACLFVFPVVGHDAPTPLRHCTDGLLFEDAEEVHLSADGHIVATTLGFKHQVLDLNAAGSKLTLRWEDWVENDVQRIALSPDGQYMARSMLQKTLLMTRWNATSKNYEWLWVADHRIENSYPEVLRFAASMPAMLAVCWNPVSDSPANDTWMELYAPKSSAPVWSELKKPSAGLVQDVCGQVVYSYDHKLVGVAAWGMDDKVNQKRVRFFRGDDGDGAVVESTPTSGTQYDMALISEKSDSPTVVRNYFVVLAGLQQPYWLSGANGLATGGQIELPI